MTLIFATWFLVRGKRQAVLRAKPAAHQARRGCSRPDQMRGKEGRARWKRKAREGKERTHEANTESGKRLRGSSIAGKKIKKKGIHLFFVCEVVDDAATWSCAGG